MDQKAYKKQSRERERETFQSNSQASTGNEAESWLSNLLWCIPLIVEKKLVIYQMDSQFSSYRLLQESNKSSHARRKKATSNWPSSKQKPSENSREPK